MADPKPERRYARNDVDFRVWGLGKFRVQGFKPGGQLEETTALHQNFLRVQMISLSICQAVERAKEQAGMHQLRLASLYSPHIF